MHEISARLQIIDNTRKMWEWLLFWLEISTMEIYLLENIKYALFLHLIELYEGGKTFQGYLIYLTRTPLC